MLRDPVGRLNVAVKEHLELLTVAMLQGRVDEARRRVLSEVGRDIPDPQAPVRVAVVLMWTNALQQRIAKEPAPFLVLAPDRLGIARIGVNASQLTDMSRVKR